MFLNNINTPKGSAEKYGEPRLSAPLLLSASASRHVCQLGALWRGCHLPLSKSVCCGHKYLAPKRSEAPGLWQRLAPWGRSLADTHLKPGTPHYEPGEPVPRKRTGRSEELRPPGRADDYLREKP
ncbi:hypothetical protein NDU88_001020 [Pleurodeles waltl]|uniref:Uncharacterized protein n=1 Tax=Pleurodeles waltl TaxID=8319 RepID=A0AAV7U561_PLEWA|nr:hypothetical protein NDU88_001020 [Pleurodeles waltl]